jgi:exosortase A
MSSLLAGIAAHVERRELAALLLIAALTVFVVLLYSQSYASMAAIWRSSEYRHGAVVFPISAYLLWRARRPLASTELRPFPWGVLLLVTVVLLWSVAHATGVQFAEHLAALVLIPATVLTFLGWPLVRRAAFPLLFLIMAVPLGDALVPQLMETTADVSTALLRATGVPVHRQGQFLSLPGGEFEVADVCSGLGYLTAGTLIAILFGYFTYQSNLKRFAFVAATAMAMIVANGVRAYIVMWVASASDMQYLAGRDHVYFGWVLFAVVIAGLTHVGARFIDRRRDEVSSMPVWREVGRCPGAGSTYRRFSRGFALSTAVAVLIAGPVLVTRQADSAGQSEVRSADSQLPLLRNCSPPGNWTADWYPALQSPDRVAAGTYFCSGKPINVFVALYLDNVQGRELVTEANRLLPEEWRRFAVRGEFSFAADTETIDVNETQFSAPGQPSLVWYWYTVGGKAVRTPTAVKLLQAVQLVVHRRADGTVYLLSTPIDESVEASRSRLSSAGRLISQFVDVNGEPGGQ